MTKTQLPAVIDQTSKVLDALTDALGVSREILASDDDIQSVWDNLPRQLRKIPAELRTDKLVKMCVAISTGLFDSAINYIWNAAIVELRMKVEQFGLNVVGQVISDSDFDEKALNELKDAELLTLCLKLNLITEEGYFFLDQCRDIRNNFSVAHPTIGNIDDTEVISFVNRCAKYALGNEVSPVGVDIRAFVSAIKGRKFTEEQTDEWVGRLRSTHEAQRELLLATLHGIYCDPSSSEESRVNALSIESIFVEELSPTIKSELIDRHQNYLALGDQPRYKASQQFFEKLGLLELLTESERHALISKACKRLLSVHQAFDNFYNEPPFAERLANLSEQGAVPDSAKELFVTTVITCAVGNAYGVSDKAYDYYEEMIKGFSQAEIAIMLELPDSNTIVAQRVKNNDRCTTAFKKVVSLIDSASIPIRSKKSYDKWISDS